MMRPASKEIQSRDKRGMSDYSRLVGTYVRSSGNAADHAKLKLKLEGEQAAVEERKEGFMTC
jgi:hypothetical protein